MVIVLLLFQKGPHALVTITNLSRCSSRCPSRRAIHSLWLSCLDISLEFCSSVASLSEHLLVLVFVPSRFANPSALYGGQKPQNREKRVSESKKPHFSLSQKRAFRVKKSPFSVWCPVEGRGFFDSKRPFLG